MQRMQKGIMQILCLPFFFQVYRTENATITCNFEDPNGAAEVVEYQFYIKDAPGGSWVGLPVSDVVHAGNAGYITTYVPEGSFYRLKMERYKLACQYPYPISFSRER